MQYPVVIENLIERLSQLPGIGKRGAERIIFWMLDQDTEIVSSLSEAIMDLKQKLRFCPYTNNLTEHEICPLYSNPTRDRRCLCIVESPKDLIAFEKTGSYKGLYYVLLNTISPSDGRGPDSFSLEKLYKMLRENQIEEVIIATDADTEGEMTAHYLTEMLKNKQVRNISRIGVGLPAGGSVEFADISTLSLSLSSRKIL